MGRRLVAILVAAVVALVGATAVLLYARGADARAVAAQQPKDVYVVQAVVPSGTQLKDAVKNGQIVKTSVAAKGLPAGALSQVDGANGDLYALSDIQPGEYVLASRFGAKPVGAEAITVPPGMVAVSVSLSDPARVGTFLRPGSHIVLFNTFTPASGSSSSAGSASKEVSTRVLLDNVQVIAMGEASLTPAPAATATATGEQAAPATAGALVTVALSPADATRLVQGIQTGQLYAALRGNDAKIDLGAVVSSASLFQN